MTAFDQSLAVGATGMLTGALKSLAQRSKHTFAVARHASRAAVGLPRTTAIDIDWRDTAAFKAVLEPVLNAPLDVALIWMHGSGSAALHWLLDRLKTHDALVVHVLSSMAPDPASFRDALDREKARCRYRTVRLGAINLSEGGTRWLTDEEISSGAIEAIDTGRDVTVGVIPA